MGFSITPQSLSYQAYSQQRTITSGSGVSDASVSPSDTPSASSQSENTVTLSADASSSKDRSGEATTDTPVSAANASESTSSATEQEAIDQVVQELSERDREVRTHEQTHAAIGGQHASAPSYTYERGPDGQLYAVEGEVKIDTSAVSGDPEATLEKAEMIMRAALSVAEPSTQDRQVASDARIMAAEARAEMIKEGGSAENSQALTQEEIRAEEEEAAEEEAERQAELDKPTLAETSDTRDLLEARTAAAEQLQSFNERLNEINQSIRKMNERLVETGALERVFPVGSVVDQSA